MIRKLLIIFCLGWMASTLPSLAQDGGDDQPSGQIESGAAAPSDSDLETRIEGIFAEIDALSLIDANVSQGVVTLGGEVANEAAAERAMRLAMRLNGVVSVEDEMNRTLDVRSNVTPAIQQLRADLNQWIRGLPLYGVALVVFVLIYMIGHMIGGLQGVWRRLAPNVFLADLFSQLVRIMAFIVAVIAALNVVGATALIGTILGGAGVIGLAVGFAVKDTIENYIASIMLSIRQPFRAKDHVVINDRAGIVVRLNSRATILMTLDGNHLRIPNAEVFKATILNYTRNPERRFDFELGVDSADDPVAAMQAGLDAIRQLEFILADPAPSALIKTVGDSNIVLTFYGWVDQSNTDFAKARSLAIRAAMRVIEEKGFTMPEPIYRLRFDGQIDKALVAANAARSAAPAPQQPGTAPTPARLADAVDDDMLDVTPAKHIEEKVSEERELSGDTEGDLLDEHRPVE